MYLLLSSHLFGWRLKIDGDIDHTLTALKLLVTIFSLSYRRICSNNFVALPIFILLFLSDSIGYLLSTHFQSKYDLQFILFRILSLNEYSSRLLSFLSQSFSQSRLSKISSKISNAGEVMLKSTNKLHKSTTSQSVIDISPLSFIVHSLFCTEKPKHSFRVNGKISQLETSFEFELTKQYQPIFFFSRLPPPKALAT